MNLAETIRNLVGPSFEEGAFCPIQGTTGENVARNANRPIAIEGVKIDARLRRRYAAMMVRLRRAMRLSSKQWHLKYTIVASIFAGRRPAYLAGGFSSEGDFIDGVLKESRTAVYRNLRVVKLATTAQVVKFTVTRIDGAIWYADVLNKSQIQARSDIDFESMRFPAVRNGKHLKLSLLEITHSELRDAIDSLASSESNQASRSLFAKAIADAVARSGVQGVNTRLTKTHLSLRAPIAGVAAIGRELARVNEA